MGLLNWIIVIAVSASIGYIGGCEHNQRKIYEYEAAGEAQQRQTEQLIEKHNRIANETKNDYESRLAAIRSAYRLRPSSSSGLSAPSSTSERIDGLPAYNVLAESCAETTQQLISLQNFIRETQ